MKISTKRLVTLSLVAAIYVVATLAIAPLSYGPVQFRISEVLNLLAFINPIYGIGVTLGCFIANIFSPMSTQLDIIFGTLATALTVFCIGKTKNIIIASLYPTIFNAIIVAWIITASMTGDMTFFMSNPDVISEGNSLGAANLFYISTAASVAIGEFVVVTIIGVPFIKFLQTKQKVFYQMLRDI